MKLSNYVSVVAFATFAMTAGGAIADPAVNYNASKSNTGNLTDQNHGTTGTTGSYRPKRLPGKMQSGTLTTAPGTKKPPQTNGAKSDNMMGNHKDTSDKQ